MKKVIIIGVATFFNLAVIGFGISRVNKVYAEDTNIKTCWWDYIPGTAQDFSYYKCSTCQLVSMRQRDNIATCTIIPPPPIAK